MIETSEHVRLYLAQGDPTRRDEWRRAASTEATQARGQAAELYAAEAAINLRTYFPDGPQPARVHFTYSEAAPGEFGGSADVKRVLDANNRQIAGLDEIESDVTDFLARAMEEDEDFFTSIAPGLWEYELPI